MATTYATLKTEIADFIERNDLTSVVDTFIDLCEAEMQRELKLLSFESSGTVTVTNGEGTLPAGFSAVRSVSWDGLPERQLHYVTPSRLRAVNATDPAFVSFYTITGNVFKVADDSSGTLNLTYMANFTPLSDGNTTNAILTNHPAAYLYGSLVHAAVYCKDFDGGVTYKGLFDAEMQKIKKDNNDKKFAGQLQVRLG